MKAKIANPTVALPLLPVYCFKPRTGNACKKKGTRSMARCHDRQFDGWLRNRPLKTIG